jgi:hypothetical protein
MTGCRRLWVEAATTRPGGWFAMDGVLRWRGNGDWGWRGGAVTASERVVSSRLDRALRRLQWLTNTTDDPERSGNTSATASLSCVLYPPAAPYAIDEAELRIGAGLPDDYRRFLCRADGAVLTATEDESERLELLGTEGLVRHAEAAAGDSAASIPELIRFATIGERGDGLAFDLTRLNPYGGCGVLDARSGRRPDQWWIIACDFTSWLLAMLHQSCPTGSFGRDWTRGPEQLPLPFPDVTASWPDAG